MMHDTLMQLLAEVADAFGITMAELRGSSRTQGLCEARAAAAWVLRERYPALTLAAIGELLGGRHHTTVINALQRVAARMQRDAAYAALVQALLAQYQAAQTLTPAQARRQQRAAQRNGAAWWVAQATPAGALSA